MQVNRAVIGIFGLLAVMMAQGCLVRDARPAGAGHVQAALPKCDVMVVGTIHKFHLANKNYPIQVFQAVLDMWRPDLVLVEIRPEAFEKGHYEDGPFEMAYITQLAKARHITVVPIDWYRESDIKAPTKADMAAAKKVLEDVKPLVKGMSGKLDFATIHDRQVTRIMLQILNARNRLQGGTPDWNMRQAWMEFRATRAIWKHRPRRVAVFVGFQHRPEMLAYLTQLGARAVNPADYLRSIGVSVQDLADRSIPKAVIELWRAGLKRLRKRVEGASGFLRCALWRKARYFQVALVQQGRCCVHPRSLVSACPDTPKKAPVTESPRPVPRPQPRPVETKPNRPSEGEGHPGATGQPSGAASGQTQPKSETPQGAQPAEGSTPRPSSRQGTTEGTSGTR